MRKSSLLLCWIAAWVWVLVGSVSSSRGAPSHIRIENCPERCECQDINCVRDAGEVYCREVEVTCVNANVTSRLEILPGNTTRLKITGENMGHMNLDMFADFTLLLKLALPNNVIRSLKLTKQMRFLNYLNLDGNRLCFFPTRNLTLLPSLKMLQAQRNNLTFIQDIQFPPSLTDLDLSHNYIKSPRKGSFRRLKRLQFLRLQNNSITEIFPRAFRHMIYLQSLFLDNNFISILGPDSFRLLPSISLISLKNNQIYRIDRTAFKQMGVRWHGLHEIRLENNRISLLEKASLELLIPRRSIYALYLTGNPLFCDCEMIQIRDESKSLIRDSDQATCAAPAYLAGVTLQDLDIQRCEQDEYYY